MPKIWLRTILILVVIVITGGVLKFVFKSQQSKVLSSVPKSEFPRLKGHQEELNDPQPDYSASQAHHSGIKDEDGFALPLQDITLPIHKLMKKRWMKDLKDYLSTIPTGSLISIIIGDSSSEVLLLNWLISAAVKTKPPLSHLLILSLDIPLQETLEVHGFDSVYVDCEHLLDRQNSSLTLVALTVKLTVMRLLNHWGYDVANYDTDAIVLKNPEGLYYSDFEKSSIVGLRGAFPPSAKSSVGLGVCAGVFMLKSTPKTGMYNLVFIL